MSLQFIKTLTKTVEVNNQKSIILPRTTRYINEVNNRKFILHERRVGIERKISKGIILLKHILSIPDYSIVNKMKSDVDIYMYLLSIMDEIEKVFDPVISGIEVRNNHFVTHPKIMELFVSIRKKIPMYESLLNKTYFDWKNEKPLRLLFTDSSELNIDIIDNTIAYNRDVPNLNIYGIDPILLIMKFLKFRKIYKNDTLNDYIRKEVFDISIMNDIINQWLFNIYIAVFEKEKAFTILSQLNESDTKSLFLISNYEYKNFKKDYERILKLLQKKQIHSQKVFSTIEFNDGRKFKEHLKDVYNTVLFQNKLQYTYINILCIYQYLYFINLVYSYDSNESKRYKVEFNYTYRILKKLIATNRLKNTKLQNFVLTKFENLERVLYT